MDKRFSSNKQILKLQMLHLISSPYLLLCQQRKRLLGASQGKPLYQWSTRSKKTWMLFWARFHPKSQPRGEILMKKLS